MQRNTKHILLLVDVCWTSIRFSAKKNVLSFGIAVSLAVAVAVTAAAVVTSTVASSLTARLQVLSHIGAFCTEFNVNNMCAWCAFISIRWALASLISASQRGICVLLSPTTTTTSPHMIFSLNGVYFLFIITIITAALRMAIYKFTNSLPLGPCNELAIFTLYFTCERFLFWFLLLFFFILVRCIAFVVFWSHCTFATMLNNHKKSTKQSKWKYRWDE